MRACRQLKRGLCRQDVAERSPRMGSCARDFTLAKVLCRRPTMLRCPFQFVRGRFVKAGCFFEYVGAHGA
jgi:hypothetical protein